MIDIEAIDLPDAPWTAPRGSRSCSCPTPPGAGEIHGVGPAAARGDGVGHGRPKPWAPVLWDVIERMTDIPQARPGGPGMFTLADAGRLRSLLAAAGFGEIHIESIPVAWTYPDFETYWRTQSSLNGAITQLLPTLPDADRRRIADAVRQAVEPFRTGSGYSAPGSALGIVATR